jgi:hypothetical protein
MKRVACVETNKNKKLTVIEDLKKNDYSLLIDALKPLNTLMYELNMINDLRSSFKELNSILNDYSSNKIKAGVLQSNIKKLIQNYLALIRSFLDGWENYIKKSFEKESEEVKNFENLKAQEYYNNFYYRFIYHLSNFSRHTGLSFHGIHTFYKDGKPDVEILLNKKEFLENFNYNKKVEDEVSSLAETKINILPYLTRMYQSLDKIHNGLIQFNINKIGLALVENSIYLIKFLNKYKSCKGEVLIIDDESDLGKIKNKENLEITLEYLPTKVALLVIRSFLKINKKNVKVFDFSGLYGGRSSNSFPHIKNRSFFEGSMLICQENVHWVRLSSTFSTDKETDKLFAIYVIGGLSSQYYKTVLDVIKTIEVSKWSSLLDSLKNCPNK